MPLLTSVNITFQTHGDDKDDDTVLHVFVKNRVNTTEGSDGHTDFISNLLNYQRYLAGGDLEDHSNNPYLAVGVNLAPSVDFGDPSTHQLSVPLRPAPVDLDDIVLPVVDIHILPDGNDRWIFDYVVDFGFDDGAGFSFSSKDDAGLPAIILDQDNRNYSGVCAENPLRAVPAPDKPVSNAVLKKVTMDFVTHDDNRDHDTRIDVRVVNRLSAASTQDIAVGLDLFPDEELTEGGPRKTVVWPSGDGRLTLNEVRLADIVLPEVRIAIDPVGDDLWIFDYRVTFEFADPDELGGKGTTYSTSRSGVILGATENKHSGVYQGRSFPTVVASPAAPLVSRPAQEVARRKEIPLALLRRKLDEFVNDRNGADTDHNPPLRRVRLHNAGDFESDAVPESYFDVRAIVASNDGGVRYVSSPTGVGQLTKLGGLLNLFLNDINSSSISVTTNPDDPTPFTATIVFETGGGEEAKGFLIGMDFEEFSISLRLTLAPGVIVDESGTERPGVDVLSWAAELEQMDITIDHFEQSTPVFRYRGTFLGQPVDLTSPLGIKDLFVGQVVKVHLVTSDPLDLGGVLRQEIRDRIYDLVVDRSTMTGRTARDAVNSMLTSWLLGGVADDPDNMDDNNSVLTDIRIEGDTIVAEYAGPRTAFIAPTPADWPSAANPNSPWDFSPGTLANIDHIVVLMMENRSFDHMLGYLSLPVAAGGAGRSDVDGLRGGESNPFRGVPFPSFPHTGTLYSPDPPHGFEPTHRAINGGLMDGFVAENARHNGPVNAGQIMGHQTAGTVPVFDALARDFAIGHRWFASHPGPTFCNRFYQLTGRLNLDTRGFWELDNSSPLRPVFTKTIFDHLSQATDPVTGQPVTWAYFEQGYSFLRFFERYTFDDANVVSIDDAERGFFVRAGNGQLPNVSFIDPRFVELPPDSNCDGAPADVKVGQEFISQVVEAVVGSPNWDRTLLVIVYDEHGGFYDHVPPSAAARVSPELPIDTHGVRVPAFIVSPWVAAGSVFGNDNPPPPPTSAEHRSDLHFDHTSILKTIARRFMSTDPPYLGARYAVANDLSSVVLDHPQGTQFRPFLPYALEFGESQLLLAVKDGSAAPGAPLVQAARDASKAERFSFEDAGDGLVYIRSQVSNLYLTVQDDTADRLTGTAPAPQRPKLPAVVQDVKQPVGPGSAQSEAEKQRRNRQTWRFNPVRDSAQLFVVESPAVPGKILQPADITQVGSPVVLGNRGQAFTDSEPVDPNRHDDRGAWKVTSPLL